MPSAPPSGTCGDGIREMCRTPAEDERRRGVCDRGLPALGLPLRSPLILTWLPCAARSLLCLRRFSLCVACSELPRNVFGGGPRARCCLLSSFVRFIRRA